MRLRNQRRAGHAETLPGCGSLLLSLVFLFLLLTRANLKPVLKSMDDPWLKLALIALWGASLFASIALIALISWPCTKWPRPK